MNSYRHTFHATCPNNGASIIYHLRIDTVRTIMVEAIVAACHAIRAGYHEEIADALSRGFGGRQTLRAFHHGVAIKTTRGQITARGAWG